MVPERILERSPPKMENQVEKNMENDMETGMRQSSFKILLIQEFQNNHAILGYHCSQGIRRDIGTFSIHSRDLPGLGSEFSGFWWLGGKGSGEARWEFWKSC